MIQRSSLLLPPDLLHLPPTVPSDSVLRISSAIQIDSSSSFSLQDRFLLLCDSYCQLMHEELKWRSTPNFSYSVIQIQSQSATKQTILNDFSKQHSPSLNSLLHLSLICCSICCSLLSSKSSSNIMIITTPADWHHLPSRYLSSSIVLALFLYLCCSALLSTSLFFFCSSLSVFPLLLCLFVHLSSNL